MLWVKSLHIVFVASWFAGLFYLPRIFVNLAQVDDTATTERLLLMARRLYRFMTMLAIPALIFGLWLWLGYGIGKGPEGKGAAGWLHAKLAIVVLLIGYHHACGSLLKKFERGANTRSHTWYRWFNEVPVLGLLAAVVLVVVKPF
jgi:putative membrane protein